MSLQCSVTCDSGYQRRAVQCRQFDGQALDETDCSAGSKPIEIQECHQEACPIPTTTTTEAPTTTPLPTTQPPPTPPISVVEEEEVIPWADESRDIIVSAANTRKFGSHWRTGAWTTVRMVNS